MPSSSNTNLRLIGTSLRAIPSSRARLIALKEFGAANGLVSTAGFNTPSPSVGNSELQSLQNRRYFWGFVTQLMSSALETQRVEMLQHTLAVWTDAGEQFEGLDRLKDRHAAAIENARSLLSCELHQFRFDGEIDDLRDP